MIDNLNAIYENTGNAAGEQEPDPKDPKPSPGMGYLASLRASPQNMARAGASFKVAGVTPSDQEKFFGETGIYDPALTGQNIAQEAGERQSFGNKLVRRLGNLVPNITADLVDMAGSATSLLTEWGDERDYRNGLNELADSMKNPFGENYKRSNDTWALSDPTWWIDNAFNTFEYAGAYALGGVGVAKAIGTVTRGLGAAANLGATGAQWLSKAGQLGTSAFVSYAQGAQDGATVFKEVYDNQLQKAIASGQDPETARKTATHIAAQSAATTAQLSTMLTMAINSGAYAPMFRTQETLARDIIGSRIAMAEKSSFKDIATTIRGMNAADYADRLMHHQGIAGVLNEMVKEGGEEVLQQFAQQTGSDIGNKGQIKGFAEQFGEMENLLDRTANSQGLFAFTLGAAFGGLQHTLIHNIIPSKNVERLAPDGTPMAKVDKDGNTVTDSQGNPVFEKRWVTPRTYEKDFSMKAFDKVKDAVLHDFTRFDDLRTEYLQAMKDKNPIRADEIRDEMFNTGKLYAVKAGMTEPWKKTFEGIAAMSPEQAVAAGYSTGTGDNAYSDKAREAITDLEHLTSKYQDLLTRYGMQYEENQGLQPLIDMVFAREADLYSTGKRINEYRTKLEADEKALGPGIDDPTQKAIAEHQALTETHRGISDDLSILNPLPASGIEDQKWLDNLLRKYRAVGFGTDLRVEAIKDIKNKLTVKQAELEDRIKNLEMQILTTPEYQQWLQKHPEGSFDEYMQEVNETTQTSTQNKFRRAQLEQAQAEYDIARENLASMTNEKNATRFMRKAEQWAKSLQKEGEEIEKQKATKMADMTKDKATLSRLERVGKNKIADQYRSDRDKVYERIKNNNHEIAAWQKELLSTKGKDILRTAALKRLITNSQKENARLLERGLVLDSLYRTNQVPVQVNPEPIEAEKVDGSIDGKDTVSATEIPTTTTTPLEADDLDRAISDLTPEQIMSEIENSSPVVTGEYATIEDELEAMRKEIEESSAIDAGTDPVKIFQDIVLSVPKQIQARLNSIVDGMLSGSLGYSLDALNPEINAGLIDITKAHKALIAARDYVEEINRLMAKQDMPVPEAPVLSGTTVEDILVQPVSTPDTPVLESDPIVTGKAPESPSYHAGYKIEDAAYTGATSTIGYEEGTRRMKNGELAYVKVTKTDALNKDLNEDILLKGKLPAGHPLRYEVDVEYEGPSMITDQLSWDGEGDPKKGTEKGIDYLDQKGQVISKPDMIGNVPIRVMDGVTGKYLFHIRKMDWINARYPNTKDYRNVVEKTETDPDNIGTQRSLLYNLRKTIVDRYNTMGTYTEGAIANKGKGTGRLILNHIIQSKDPQDMNINSKVVPGLAYNRKNPDQSLLPDENLELVIVGEGGVPQSGKGFNFNKPLGITTDDLVKGAIGAMVPAANGQYMYAPLIGMKLVEPGKPSPALASVTRAIELFILNDGTDPTIGKEIAELEQNTNFNVGTTKGLRAFINQYYTYMQDFRDSALSPNATTGDRIEQFVFSVDISAEGVADKTKQIKAGFTMRGDGVQYANVVNGSLSPNFINLLAEGFAQRSRAVVFTDSSVGIRGINSRGLFYDAVYVPGKGWKHTMYDSYNQYVKSFSKTPVYGRNKLSDGSFVYTANPQLPIDPPNTSVQPAVVKPNTKVTEVLPVAKTQIELDAELFDQLGNFSLPRLSPVQGFGTGSDNSVPLTLAALTEKYNFTPEAQRNGKTVLEVLEELTGRGHTYLSDGYNPFSRCL